MKHIIMTIIGFLAIWTLAAMMILNVTETEYGEYEKVYEEGASNIRNVTNEIIDIQDEAVYLNIQGDVSLMKEGEIYEMNDDKKNYVGTVEVVEINNDNVKLNINAERTINYYVSVFLYSLIITILFMVLICLFFVILDE